MLACVGRALDSPCTRRTGETQTCLSMHITLPPWRKSVTARPAMSYRANVSSHNQEYHMSTQSGPCVLMHALTGLQHIRPAGTAGRGRGTGDSVDTSKMQLVARHMARGS